MQHLSSYNQKIVEFVMSANRMFVLLGETCEKTKEERCLQVDISDKSKMWRHQYGHLNHKDLLTLHNKGMVIGLPDTGRMNITCEACAKEK